MADESVDRQRIDQLRKDGYSVWSVTEMKPGLTDDAVLQKANQETAILLTADKDFGELVFSHGIKYCSVIFLRYNKMDYDIIEKSILKVIKDYYENPGHYFITITKRKIRIRKI